MAESGVGMRRHLYFVNAPLDFTFMGGLSLLVFAYFQFCYRGYSNLQVSDTALAFAGVGAWVVNYPHFAATNYRLYQSPDHLRQFPLTAFLLPVFIFLGTVACFLWPREFAPAWAKVYVLWSMYHYTGQNLGLSLIYAKRAGVEISSLSRRVLSAFLYLCFIAQYAGVESKSAAVWVFSIAVPLIELPHWFVAAMAALAYASGALLLVLAMQWIRKHRALPAIVALPVAAQFCWTILGAENFSFQALLPYFHGLQYLFVAWAVEMHARSASRQMLPATARWTAVNLVVGAALFFGLPRLLALAGVPLELAVAVIFASVQIHHFFVDGVIWKLRGEKASSPLFRNFRGEESR